MRAKQIVFVTGIVLALLSAAGSRIQASGDTPIVILDGSLSIQSAVPWKEFKAAGDLRSHPNAEGAITNVVVTIGGKNQTIACNGQRCSIDVTYAGSDIIVESGADGKGLSLSPFSLFQDGPTPDVIMHKNQKAKISHVSVTMSGVKLIDSPASGGGTKVVISFE
ncbi:MAG TPA: hypothetical protein VHW09_19275 [Bryobacteraceae bacterium]|jgi:hypothetical protein|nr:hypothetical protein [Bryobacteraceae bacterium]